MATLAAALIVRDEAASLARCLGSLSSFVDQIVVVDTGSTDDSRAVARDHGATLGSFTWVDDFAAARNASLELVTTDWVLYIDADEELLATDHRETRDLLDGSPGAVAAQVLFHPRVGWTPYREWRLFRSRPDLRFRGVIHESILADVERIIADEGATTAETTLTMQHHGYDGDVSHKHPRDLPLLVAALDSEPDRAYLWDHLARLLHHRGDRLGAEATWLAGIDRALHRGRSDPDDRLLWLGVIGSRVRSGDRSDEVAALIDDAIARFGELPTLELFAGRLDLARGDAHQAAQRARWLLNYPNSGMLGTGLSFDARVFGEWAWVLLAEAESALGRHEQASHAWFSAESVAPDEPSYRIRRLLARSRVPTSWPDHRF